MWTGFIESTGHRPNEHQITDHRPNDNLPLTYRPTGPTTQ